MGSSILTIIIQLGWSIIHYKGLQLEIARLCWLMNMAFMIANCVDLGEMPHFVVRVYTVC